MRIESKDDLNTNLGFSVKKGETGTIESYLIDKNGNLVVVFISDNDKHIKCACAENIRVI